MAQPNTTETFDFETPHPRSQFKATKWLEMDVNFGKNDLIPMWVADMDFKVAPAINRAILEMADHGIYGYMYREPAYFEAIANWYQTRHQWTVKAETIIFSPGVICSLSLLIESLTNVGDKIIIQEPVYYPFKAKILDSHRLCVVNTLTANSDGHYAIDFRDFKEKLIAEKPKVFILCSPHNPVGRVWTKEELTRLGQLCLEHQVRVIADEIHCDLVFAPHQHIPFASISPEFSQNTITLSAPSKTFNLAGLQTSFAICTNPSDHGALSNGLARLDIKRNNSFSLVATQAAYTEGAPWLEALLETLKANADFAVAYLADHLPFAKVSPLEGTYLLWVNMSQNPLGLGDMDLERHLVEKAGIAASRGISFGAGGEGFIRLNLACPRAQLTDALEHLCQSF